MLREYKSIEKVTPSVLSVCAAAQVGEYCEIMQTDGGICCGRVIAVDKTRTYVKLRDAAARIGVDNVSVRFTGNKVYLSASERILGRVFDGTGNPYDGFGKIISDNKKDIHAGDIKKASPTDSITTGIAALDAFTSLFAGQSLTVVVPHGVPHREFLSAVVTGVASEFGGDKMNVIYAFAGTKEEEANYITEEFADTGNFDRTVFFVNLEEDTLQTEDTAHTALAAAEYFAFECGRQVICVIDGISKIVDAALENAESIAAATGENITEPDIKKTLEAIYSRAGKGADKGSITLICVLTEENANISHITESLSDEQIYLSRELYKKGIYPPVDPAAARAKQKERAGHEMFFAKLTELYSQGMTARKGIESGAQISEWETALADFANGFESGIIAQNLTRYRTLEQVEAAGQKLIVMLENRK